MGHMTVVVKHGGKEYQLDVPLEQAKWTRVTIDADRTKREGILSPRRVPVTEVRRF